jgi:hypothetical protein
VLWISAEFAHHLRVSLPAHRRHADASPEASHISRVVSLSRPGRLSTVVTEETPLRPVAHTAPPHIGDDAFLAAAANTSIQLSSRTSPSPPARIARPAPTGALVSCGPSPMIWPYSSLLKPCQASRRAASTARNGSPLVQSRPTWIHASHTGSVSRLQTRRTDPRPSLPATPVPAGTRHSLVSQHPALPQPGSKRQVPRTLIGSPQGVYQMGAGCCDNCGVPVRANWSARPPAAPAGRSLPWVARA